MKMNDHLKRGKEKDNAPTPYCTNNHIKTLNQVNKFYIQKLYSQHQAKWRNLILSMLSLGEKASMITLLSHSGE